MVGALALPVAARAGAVRPVKAPNWEGALQLMDAKRKITDIHVKTRVEPSVARARSETYLLGDPTHTRTLIIEPEGGWTERDGVRTPLPEAQAHHERQQYALYGFLLAARERGDGKGLRLTRGGYPPFDYDSEKGRVTIAHYSVDAPEGGGTIVQTIRPAQWEDVGGLLWPQVLVIEQHPGTAAPDGSFLALLLTSMTVEFA